MPLRACTSSADWACCSPFRVTEDDVELSALRKTFDKAGRRKKGAAQQQQQPAEVPEQQRDPQLEQDWSGISAIPSFTQLNASLRQARPLLQAVLPAPRRLHP